MQNTISERTTRETLKKMGYRSRRPHHTLLSAKIRKESEATISITFGEKKDWENVTWPQFQHLDGRVRIWSKQHKSMDPSCLVSSVQAGGIGVRG